MECKQAGSAPTAHHTRPVSVEECREHATVEPYAEARRREQLDAAAGANRESDLVVVCSRVSRESERARQKRPDAAAGEFLQAAALPMIDGDPPACRWAKGLERKLGEGLLVAEHPFDLKTSRERHIENEADGRGAVHVERASGDDLKQVTAKSIAAVRRNFNTLRAHRVHADDADVRDRRRDHARAGGHGAFRHLYQQSLYHPPIEESLQRNERRKDFGLRTGQRPSPESPARRRRPRNPAAGGVDRPLIPVGSY